MKTIPSDAEARELELCLTFANTVSWHASEQPVEHLQSYTDLVAWSVQQGILDEQQAEPLRVNATHDPATAHEVVAGGRGLREAIYRVFTAQAHSMAADDADLARINSELARIAPFERIERVGEAYRWNWIASDAPDRMLWPVIRSAGLLLTNEELLARVGQCADDRGCGWLFLDLSKNHSRRWCDINDCGNRAKQQRYQQRARNNKAAVE